MQCSRLLISQDRHEVYLNFAEFDDLYIGYVKGRSKAPVSLLRMHEYGPFDITNGKHMKALGEIVLAFEIDVCS